METKKKRLVIIGACVAAVVIGVVLFLTLGNDSIRATTMKLLRMEGEITLEENGKTKEVKASGIGPLTPRSPKKYTNINADVLPFLS